MSNIPKKPKNARYTDQQWQAIFETDHHLLVSASAGSGKTRILVQRVIEKIKAGANIDEFLVVTFTELAAKEMKTRIDIELKSAIEEKEVDKKLSPEMNQHFLKQLTLLPNAQISTLHSFCMTVIRRYFYLIELDPSFRLTDETEGALLKEDVWNDLLELEYDSQSSEFFRFVENFSEDRSDKEVTNLVMTAYNFARANPNPILWLDQLDKQYSRQNSLTEVPIYKDLVKPNMLSICNTVMEALSWAKSYIENEPKLEKVYDLLSNEYDQAVGIYQLLASDNIDDAYKQIANLTFKNFPPIRDAELKELSGRVKPAREKGKKLIQSLSQYLPYDPKEMMELLGESQPIAKELSRLTTLFLKMYQERKLSKGILDFNDLEHYTLEILNTTNELDVSEFYRNKYKEVLVDEYQDINRLQQAILEKVAQSVPGNLFMVGDVKQSIYAFRLADPTLFISKYEEYEQHKNGEKIDLKENFRSRSEVLDFINLIFEQLMDKRVGQVDYEGNAKLVSGATYYREENKEQFLPEILLYEKETPVDIQTGVPISIDSIDTKAEGEIHITAQKIRKLLDEKMEIFDRSTMNLRELKLSDIVLLTPTRKNHLTILDIFKQYQLAVELSDAQNYFQATEVQTILALLQIIDNPLQDIPYVSVLRSPIVGLGEDELVDIRLSVRDVSFYEATQIYVKDLANEKTATINKLTVFLDMFGNWRNQSRKVTVAELLEQIYEETAYPDFVLGLPSGKQRFANLMAFITRAESYEKTSFRGLYQFIRFIEKMREKDKDLARPVSESSSEAIRMMTIHGSKGLEFPIVFVMDMNRQFNIQELNKKYLFDEKLGVGIQLVNDEKVSYKTLPYEAIKQSKQRKSLSEEMRKLYVALTRAEQKLYLVGSYDSEKDTIKKWSKAITEEEQFLDENLRLTAQSSMMDWVGMTIIRHPMMKTKLDDPTLQRKVINHSAQFEVNWKNGTEIMNEYDYWQKKLTKTSKVLETSTTYGAIPKKVLDRLTFNYPHEKSTMTTSYQSVSEIKQLFNDPDNLESHRFEWLPPETNQRAIRKVGSALARPKFIDQETSDATLIGQATHSVLQRVGLHHHPTAAEITYLINELVELNIISADSARKIDQSSIQWFFESEIGSQLIQHADRVSREKPFSMLKQANEIYDGFGDESAEVLIHGIIDGFIEFDEHIILYDFKTDHIRMTMNEEQIVDTYRGQLNLYKQALEQSLGKKVTQSYLVLLSAKKMILL